MLAAVQRHLELVNHTDQIVYDDFAEYSPQENRQKAYTSFTHSKENPSALPEFWFARLDGRLVEAAGARWKIAVSAIRHLESDVWIQVALDGPSAENLVLRATPAFKCGDVLAAIASWLASPWRTDRVLTVA